MNAKILTIGWYIGNTIDIHQDVTVTPTTSKNSLNRGTCFNGAFTCGRLGFWHADKKTTTMIARRMVAKQVSSSPMHEASHTFRVTNGFALHTL